MLMGVKIVYQINERPILNHETATRCLLEFARKWQGGLN